MPTPLRELKSLALGFLGENLNAFLLNLDTLLLTEATTCHHQTEQNAFYFAMRALRERKIDVLESFNYAVTQALVALLDKDREDSEPSINDLAVLENEATDELLALQYLAKKCFINNKKSLLLLTARIEVFCSGALSVNEMPASPMVIANALSSALAALDLDIVVRLKIYNFFDLEMQKFLPNFYVSLNAHLSDHGILPAGLDARSSTSSKAKKTAKKTSEDESGYLLGGDHQCDFLVGMPTKEENYESELANACAQLKQHIMRTSAPTAHASSGSTELNRSSTELNSNNENINRDGVSMSSSGSPLEKSLHSILEQLQIFNRNDKQVGAQSSQHTMAQLAQSSGVEQVLALVKELNSAIKSPMSSNADAHSKVLLNELMAAAFAEESLALPVKTLLGRLQISLAKIMEVNPEFLHNEQHSARLLLNALLRSGSSWHKNDAEQLTSDPLYQKMAEIVGRAVTEAPHNETVFSELLTDFEKFNQREQQRMELIEKRLLAVEEGRAKSEQARLAVAKAIADVCKNKTLCGAINDLIHSAWHQVLFMEYLKHGEDSLEFVGALQVLRDSLDATLERADPIFVRKLLEELKTGLQVIGFDVFDGERLITPVADAIKMASFAKAKKTQPVNASVNSSVKTSLNSLASTTGVGAQNAAPLLTDSVVSGSRQATQTLSDKGKTADGVNSAAKLQAENTAIDTSRLGTAQDTSAEVLLLTESLTTIENATAKVADADPVVLMTKSLKRGSWFDFTDDKQSTKRCRLVAVIEGVDVYIFVNRHGQKIMEKKLAELVEALRTGVLQLVDNSHLFDNALEKIIVGMRK
ncbi:MAG: DUF1631 family protein [Marinagarivorans sp.]|nr:DUF1631 family protein [Marinagarivorans sp.]